MHYILHYENICNALCIKALSYALLNIKKSNVFQRKQTKTKQQWTNKVRNKQ